MLTRDGTDPNPIRYARPECPVFARRVIASLIDLGIPLSIAVLLNALEFIAEWGGHELDWAIVLAAAILWSYSLGDVNAAGCLGRRLMGVRIVKVGGYASGTPDLLVRWWCKWWPILLSPVLFDCYRPTGQIMRPLQLQWLAPVLDQYSTVSIWVVALWILCDAVLLVSPGHRSFHDRLAGTSAIYVAGGMGMDGDAASENGKQPNGQNGNHE